MARVPSILPPLRAAWGRYRRVERGVKLFALFVLLLASGFVVMLSGHPFPAAVCGLLALASLLAMALSTPPRVRERRMVTAVVGEEGDRRTDREEAGGDGLEGGDVLAPKRPRSGLDDRSMDAQAAPTRSRRDIKPPPEVSADAAIAPAEEPAGDREEEIWV